MSICNGACLLLIPLLLICIATLLWTNTTPSTHHFSRRKWVQPTGFPGNPDIYGLGHPRRLLHPSPLPSFLDNINVLFIIAMLIGIGFVSRDPATTYAVEPYMLLQITYCIAYVGTNEFRSADASYWVLRDLSFLGLDGYSFYFWWSGLDQMMPTPGPEGAVTNVWWLTQADLYGWVRVAAKVAVVGFLVFRGMRLAFTLNYACEWWKFRRATTRQFWRELKEDLGRELRAKKVDRTSKKGMEEGVKEKETYLAIPDIETTGLPVDGDDIRPRRTSHRRCRSLTTIRSQSDFTSRSPSPIRFNISLHVPTPSTESHSSHVNSSNSPGPICDTFGGPWTRTPGLPTQIPTFTELYTIENYLYRLLPHLHPSSPAFSTPYFLSEPLRLAHLTTLLYYNSLTTPEPLAWYRPPIVLFHTLRRAYRNHPPAFHFRLLTELHLAHVPAPRCSKVTFILGPVLSLLVVSLLVIAGELTIQWNGIKGVQGLGSVGQLVPAVIGVGGLFRVGWGVGRQVLGLRDRGRRVWHGGYEGNRDRREVEGAAEVYFRIKEELERRGRKRAEV
ncbi:uncharacterized protein BDZ99DRAFT_502455 [Mytilinidion resinicola]|uniref:Uncharacterized protein n=1 Tax=Mytilinidion resinicola TaxID=574789 RepID=A0A6A6Y6Y8_9PEZI|nr:uncharacterized protein BDZ99DRAFT_502455 [Mytilinidion resinicola]KAF2804586.1 hypothetical protein BDZ99DRAFT_502455 [Mytilinidion resinicola]